MTVVASGAWVAMASAPTAAAASGAAYLSSYLVALALTLVVEVPVYAVLARVFAWVSWPLALVAGVIVNLLTHPLLYAASLRFDAWWQLAAAETIVALVEGSVLVWAWRRRPTESWVWVGAVVANALSVLVGLVVLVGLPGLAVAA
ncbi:MAG: hypothetical protein V9F04_16410 [Dermatophilaceae bacterium]